MTLFNFSLTYSDISYTFLLSDVNLFPFKIKNKVCHEVAPVFFFFSESD